MRIFCAECNSEFEVPVNIPEHVEFVCSDCILDMVELYQKHVDDDLSDERVLH